MVKVSNPDEIYLMRCIELAREGLGRVAPNPMVGAVLVHKGNIIGEGFHMKYGGPHAEVNALSAVTDRTLYGESTLFVNLEPCSHTGKTPPCADLIIASGIPCVVVGSVDPNPLVSGNGIKKLLAAGIKVRTGIMEDECRSLNRRFFTWHVKKRPYIVLKWAKSMDGFIDIVRSNINEDRPAWISNQVSKILVHKWRSEEQGILVGTNTAFLDNPRLNTREWKGNDPMRMVIDRVLKLPRTHHFSDNTQNTMVFNELTERTESRIRYLRIDFGPDFIKELLSRIYEEGIQSVMVEGGRKLLETFISSGMWDEARVFTGGKIFNKGVKSPVIEGIKPEEHRILDDLLQVYFNL